MNKRFLLGIIGHPIGHSLSPIMHKIAAAENGIGQHDFFYEKFNVTPEDLPLFMKKFRDGDMTGLNVTVPHKMAVMEFLDEIDDDAKAIGAVNTIARREGKLHGYNTDTYGFIHSITENADLKNLEGKRAFVYGAGGAARAVVCGLAKAGVAGITIANRSVVNAEKLASSIGGAAALKAVGFGDEKSLIESVQGADIIVNTTSVGMEGGADPAGALPGLEGLRSGQLAVDIVYRPLKTPFLISAEKAGAATLDGLWMLIHQGAKAFEMWTGLPFPVGKARQALLEELNKHR